MSPSAELLPLELVPWITTGVIVFVIICILAVAYGVDVILICFLKGHTYARKPIYEYADDYEGTPIFKGYTIKRYCQRCDNPEEAKP